MDEVEKHPHKFCVLLNAHLHGNACWECGGLECLCSVCWIMSCTDRVDIVFLNVFPPLYRFLWKFLSAIIPQPSI